MIIAIPLLSTHSEFLALHTHLSSPNQILITERRVVINAMDIDSHWDCCTPLVMVTSLNGEGMNTCKLSSLHIKAGSSNQGPMLCNKTAHLAANWPKLSLSKLIYYIAIKEINVNYASFIRIKNDLKCRHYVLLFITKISSLIILH